MYIGRDSYASIHRIAQMKVQVLAHHNIEEIAQRSFSKRIPTSIHHIVLRTCLAVAL